VEAPPVIPQIQHRPSRFPLWWVLAINGLEFLLTIPFYLVPRGTPIRPMGWALYVVVLAFAALAAVPMVVPTLRRNPRMVWPWIVLVLALTPFPLARGMYWHAERVCGFISEP
jgi:hypothetical protein